MELGECKNSVRADGQSDEPTLMPHENDALPANCLTKSQSEKHT